jgi:hypothetical protein
MLQDSSKKQGILASAVAVKKILSLLSLIESDVQNELSKVLSSTVNIPLPDGEVDVLKQGIAKLTSSLVHEVMTISFWLTNALYKFGVETMAQPETGVILTIAASMSDLKNSLEHRCSWGSLTDYGPAKIQVPQFEGDIPDYSNWRSEVEDHLSNMAGGPPRYRLFTSSTTHLSLTSTTRSDRESLTGR